MVRRSRGTRFTGSTLLRLLARLASAEVPASKQAFAERLSHWLGWTDAIGLSAALDQRPARAQPAPSGAAIAVDAAEAQLQRLRTMLERSIADEFAPPARKPTTRQHPPPLTPADAETDFPPLRHRYVAKQQAMELAIDALRTRLREALAQASPEMARLAAVDAVMERVLGAQERTLLATVPALLEKRFMRLREAHALALADGDADSADDADPAPAPTPAPWLDTFRRDLQAVLLAELEIRLQPAEALIEALRTGSPDHP